MLFEVVFLSLIGDGICEFCTQTYYTTIYIYCSGYCTGSYGFQTCNYYYVLSGGAIAGVVIGVLAAIAIFVAIVVVCIKNQTRGRMGTVVAPNRVGANIAIVNTTNTGYNQPFYSAPPAATTQYNYGYQNPQQNSMPYPPVGSHGFSAPTQPQYNPTYSYMPQAHI